MSISYRLSSMQKAMLLHGVHGTSSTAYMVQLDFAFDEAADARLLEEAWRRIIARHDLLRTSFEFHAPVGPVQRVHGEVDAPLRRIDIGTLPPGVREERLRWIIMDERTLPFDPARAPLARFTYIHTSGAENHLLWTFHHAILDGRSILLLLTELFEIHGALGAGSTPRLGAPRPYREYIEWLDSRNWDRAEEYWRSTLRDFRAPTPLPVERRHPGGETGRRHHRHCLIDIAPEHTAALRSIAAAHGVTLNTILQGAWALLLGRCGGGRDIVFGATRACRRFDGEERQPLVGLFINTVPVRARIEPGIRLLPWLAKLREQWIAMREHEHTPLESIHRWSDVARTEPLFESFIVFESYRLEDRIMTIGAEHGLRSVSIHSDTQYPLSISARDGLSLSIDLECAPDLLDEAATARLARHLRTLLEGIAVNPERRLSEIPILAEEERRSALVAGNGTERRPRDERCTHEIFTERAAAKPDSVAVVQGDSCVSYGELDRRARLLAAGLREAGVGPETIVAIRRARSIELVTEILAVLEAGGAYLLLDPDYPPDRLAFMLDDARPLVVIGAGTEIRGHGISGSGENRPAATFACTPLNIASVVYTSGSTGSPKGIMVTHASLVNVITSSITSYGVDGNGCIPQCASISFDFAAEELFVALCSGSKLVLRGETTLNSAASFIEWCREEAFTVIELPTAIWHRFAEGIEADDLTLPPSLHTIAIGGEQAFPDPMTVWLESGAAGLRIVNTYGPAEATIVTTGIALTLDAVDAVGSSGIPIGKPIENTGAYILDGDLSPAPTGVAGEIYIGGVGIARGYLNRPGLTAERFLPDPSADAGGGRHGGTHRGARLYRTGDRARRRDDGVIEFRGRLDSQVKIRGFRIEPGEVESAIARHPDVCGAAVVAREDPVRGRHLVGYVVLKSRAAPHSPERDAPTPSELRAFLVGSLPAYMVPERFVILDAFPTTPNHKIDRAALPDPAGAGGGRTATEEGAETARAALDESGTSSRADRALPRTEAERTLAAIWREFLRRDSIGIHDNFFDLGGHSLLLMQINGRLKRAFNREISMVEMFRYSTIASLAAYLCRAPEGDEAARAGSSRVKRRPGTEEARREFRRKNPVPRTGTRGGVKPRHEEGT